MASPAMGKSPSSPGKPGKTAPEQGAHIRSENCWGILDHHILAQLHDGVLAMDLDGNIKGGNQAALQMLGYAPEQLLGKNLAFFYPEKEQGLMRNTVISTVRKDHKYHGEITVQTKSGQELDVYLSLTLLVNLDSSPVGIAALLTDISDGKLLVRALVQNQDNPHNTDPRSIEEQRKPGLVKRDINGVPFLIASPAMHKFMKMVERIAGHPEIALITGETGVGKELIARSIHENSHRSDKPLVDINCAALPEQLMESELFGYEKGAFSGADASKPGLFELADRGTLFLDEIGELDPKLQVKLLRVLDGAPYYRLGGHRKITVDVRIIAATNQNLEIAVEEGRFRKDLFHRLSQIQLRVPPLRERPEDVVALAQHFLALKNNTMKFSPDALSALASYNWPGNVRELRNLVVKVAMAEIKSEITAGDLLTEPAAVKRRTEFSLPATNLEGMEEQMIIRALETTGGHRGLAAEQLGISRRTLSRKIREYAITCPEDERGRAMGTIGSEQQKFFRAKVRFMVTLKNNRGEETSVTGVNLSTGGLGVEDMADPQRFGGLLDSSFLLPETETLIQAKVRIAWADASGRAGIRFVVLDPALFEHIHHWTAQRAREEGWELAQQI
jgi:PAS domain S-box-containing protein